jgi:hypothetical protein
MMAMKECGTRIVGHKGRPAKKWKTPPAEVVPTLGF